MQIFLHLANMTTTDYVQVIKVFASHIYAF